ncbi:MAG: transaldolase family protein, partial [Anaerolineae bacterium]
MMTFNTSPHLIETVKTLAREGFPSGEAEPTARKSNRRWKELRRLGTKLWLDTGDVEGAARQWTAEFSALTTNNTLLNREVQKGIYDDFIGRTLSSSGAFRDLDRKQKIIEIALVLNARHGLKLVDRFDADVSVELHTDLANDLEGTVWYGKRLFDMHPERFIVKVPLTASGYLAARRLKTAGVRVNFTLGFSARQNYLAALLAEPTFVNVFLGRLNSVVDDNDLGAGNNVGEKTLVASQEAITEVRAQRGLTTQQIAASMRSGDQVEALAAVDVMTLPLRVAEAFVSAEAQTEGLVPYEQQRYPVDLKAGPSRAVVNALWDVPQAFKETAQRVLDEPVYSFTADDLQGFFIERGFGDLFPAWSEDDIQTITEDGKI